MKVSLFDISFDDGNAQAVYRSGGAIKFKVHLQLLKPVKCRGLFVKLYGGSNVHWTESRTVGSGDHRRTETVHYHSQEVYVNQKVAIYTPETSGPNAEHHPAGEFVYPVSIQIPASAPSSFQGSVGSIRYYIKAHIDRPWKFDKYTQKFFTVIRDLDLNAKPMDLIGPFSTNEDFNVKFCNCFNCGCGKIRVCIALPKRGYVPGEQVHVTGDIYNSSKTDLQSVNLEVYQQCIFYAQGRTRWSTRVASCLQLEGVQQGRSMRLNHLLPVCPVPSSHLEGCGNIDLNYFFRLNADGGCCLSVRKKCCELIIGTVPLLSHSWAPPPPLPPPVSTLTPVEQQPAPSAYSGNGVSPFVPPPPSYQECMFGRVEMNKDSDGKSFGTSQTQWAPSYPVFAMAPSAPPGNSYQQRM